MMGGVHLLFVCVRKRKERRAAAVWVKDRFVVEKERNSWSLVSL